MLRAHPFATLAISAVALTILAGCSSSTHDPATMTGGTQATTTSTMGGMGGMKPGETMPPTTHDMGGMKSGSTMAPGK